MSKYDPLGEFLRGQNLSRIPMTFKDIEKILNFQLPNSARSHRAWWSNNPSNSVMTYQWLEAGYKTASVDLGGEKLIFERDGAKANVPASSAKHQPIAPATTPAELKRASIFGCLKGLFVLEGNFDPASPSDLEPGWDRKYEAGP